MGEFSWKGSATNGDTLSSFNIQEHKNAKSLYQGGQEPANQSLSLSFQIWCISLVHKNVGATNKSISPLNITTTSCGFCCGIPGPGGSSTLRSHRLGRSSQSWGKLGYDKSNKMDSFPVPFQSQEGQHIVCLFLYLNVFAPGLVHNSWCRRVDGD